MSDSSTVDTIQKATGIAAVGFGLAGVLTPGLLARTYGLKDDSADFRYMGRMWGTRTGVIGVVTLTTPPGPARRSLFTAAVAMNAVDALSVASGRGIPLRTRMMAGLTSAGFAAAGVYALTNGA
jgi:hypothetical protein